MPRGHGAKLGVFKFSTLDIPIVQYYFDKSNGYFAASIDDTWYKHKELNELEGIIRQAIDQSSTLVWHEVTAVVASFEIKADSTSFEIAALPEDTPIETSYRSALVGLLRKRDRMEEHERKFGDHKVARTPQGYNGVIKIPIELPVSSIERKRGWNSREQQFAVKYNNELIKAVDILDDAGSELTGRFATFIKSIPTPDQLIELADALNNILLDQV